MIGAVRLARFARIVRFGERLLAKRDADKPFRCLISSQSELSFSFFWVEINLSDILHNPGQGFCNKCNMEGDGLRWERLRDRWVERVFWGKSGLDRVLQRNNSELAAQQVHCELRASRKFEAEGKIIRPPVGDGWGAGAWIQACRGRRPKAKRGEGSETHSGADRAAEEASWTKRARLSRSESVSPIRVAFAEDTRPNQGERFKWR